MSNISASILANPYPVVYGIQFFGSRIAFFLLHTYEKGGTVAGCEPIKPAGLTLRNLDDLGVQYVMKDNDIVVQL